MPHRHHLHAPRRREYNRRVRESALASALEVVDAQESKQGNGSKQGGAGSGKGGGAEPSSKAGSSKAEPSSKPGAVPQQASGSKQASAK